MLQVFVMMIMVMVMMIVLLIMAIIAGIQAKLYNQDLSLDASFDAGGNIGRFWKTQCFPSHFPHFEQLLLSSQWDHRLHFGLSMDLGGHFAPEHWCLIFVLVIHIVHIMAIMVTLLVGA